MNGNHRYILPLSKNSIQPHTTKTITVHHAAKENILNYSTYTDLELANENPSAVIVITPNWSPGGKPNGIYNDHIMGL